MDKSVARRREGKKRGERVPRSVVEASVWAAVVTGAAGVLVAVTTVVGGYIFNEKAKRHELRVRTLTEHKRQAYGDLLESLSEMGLKIGVMQWIREAMDESEDVEDRRFTLRMARADVGLDDRDYREVDAEALNEECLALTVAWYRRLMTLQSVLESRFGRALILCSDGTLVDDERSFSKEIERLIEAVGGVEAGQTIDMGQYDELERIIRSIGLKLSRELQRDLGAPSPTA